jgi:hypothetical protein
VLRSLVRILALTSILLCLAVLAASLGFTQPLVWGREPRARLVADPVRLRLDVEQLALGFGPRDLDHPSSLAASADFVAARLSESVGRVERQAWDAHGVTLENIVGRLGSPGAPLVVVGAHYDTFGDAGPNPGADDNASGVAGLLELARLLAPLRLPVAVELVAFSGEEPPLFATPQMGSRVYAERLLERGQTPAVMVCLEMIGMFTRKQPWPSWLLRALFPDRGDFVLVLGRPEDRHWTAWLLSAFRGRNAIRARSWVGPSISGADASDHRSFWELGLPAVMVTDTAFLRNPHYHTADDLPATLDYDSMARIVEGLAFAVSDPKPSVFERSMQGAFCSCEGRCARRLADPAWTSVGQPSVGTLRVRRSSQTHHPT